MQIAKEAGLHDMGWMGSKSYIDNKLKVTFFFSCPSCGYDTKKRVRLFFLTPHFVRSWNLHPCRFTSRISHETPNPVGCTLADSRAEFRAAAEPYF